MSAPSSEIVPDRTGRSPNTAFTKVDFPAPFGPTTPTISPRATCRSQPFRMSTSGR